MISNNKMKQILFKKKGNIFLFLFLLSFFSFSLVVAQPPPSTQTNINIDVGLQIEFTQVSIFENGEDHLFNAHVFNISTGLRVDNTTTQCSFHLFDNKGDHQIDQVPMIFDTFGIDWDYNVSGENFTRNGDYSYLIVCNSTDIGGFLSSGFTITPTGLGDIFDFYIIILLVSIILIAMGFWMKDPWVVIFGTFGLYFSGLYILLNGIVGIKDMITTWAIALTLLGVAAYISLKAAQEVINA